MLTGADVDAQQAQNEGAGSESSPEGQAPKPAVSFADRLFAPFRSHDDPKSAAALARGDHAPAKTEDESEAGDEADDKTADGKAPKEGEPYKVFGTKEEYDRDLQAESDRRAARAQSRAAAQQARDEKARLRRDDPETYAAKEEEEEQQVAFASTIIGAYDAEILGPALQRLPEDKRQDVYASINSVETRQAALATVFKHVEDDAYSRGLAEGEKKALAKGAANPAIKKAVLRDMRVVEPEPADAVESRGGRAEPSGNQGMNDFLRKAAGVQAH